MILTLKLFGQMLPTLLTVPQLAGLSEQILLECWLDRMHQALWMLGEFTCSRFKIEMGFVV